MLYISNTMLGYSNILCKLFEGKVFVNLFPNAQEWSKQADT